MRVFKSPLQDPKTFSNLYEHTQIIIFRFIYGMHGGPIEEVEDLTCDTFMRAWKGRSRFFGDDHDALCWLFTIARRLVIDAHRRKKAHPENNNISLDDIDISSSNMSPQMTPEEQISNREQFIHLLHILQNFSDDKREMLVLRYMLGWRVTEIAEYLHKDENTISVSIRRCLQQIRREWSVD
jgi:RNA polymerase sigma-70 factor (ECF subfamily)